MRLPTDNAFLMLASAGLAFLLWFWVGAEERSEIVVTVPLEYRNLPKAMEISSDRDLLSIVNVWVRGTTASVKNLKPQEISAWVDLQNAKAGERHFELTPSNVNVPYGFSVLRISPSRVNLRIEQVTTRRVPVIPRLHGEPPEGYAVMESTVTPSQVEITGPQSAVSSVRSVITDSIDVSTIKGSHVERVNIGVENSMVRLSGTKEVTVALSVREINDVITLRRIPVSSAGTKYNVKFNPKTVRVDLLAPKRLLAQVSDDTVQAILELNGLKPGDYELTPRIVFGPAQQKVSVKAVSPERIHVRILE